MASAAHNARSMTKFDGVRAIVGQRQQADRARLDAEAVCKALRRPEAQPARTERDTQRIEIHGKFGRHRHQKTL